MTKEDQEKEKEIVSGQIEAHPTAFSYVVDVGGERVQTENPETAIILSMLEKIYKKLEKN
jgi:hypothetical protein